MTAFTKLSWWRHGYATEEVDQFLEHARAVYESEQGLTGDDVLGVDFALVRGGYAPGEVDGALDRLARAVVKNQAQAFAREYDEKEWLAVTAEKATGLYPRLRRPEGQKFERPRRGYGYDAAEVDAFMKRISAYFSDNSQLSFEDVRGVTFTLRKGKKAYCEASVDAYLKYVAEILLAVE